MTNYLLAQVQLKYGAAKPGTASGSDGHRSHHQRALKEHIGQQPQGGRAAQAELAAAIEHEQLSFGDAALRRRLGRDAAKVRILPVGIRLHGRPGAAARRGTADAEPGTAGTLGVPATEVARRAGHGVAVLLKIYAHCINGQAAAAKQRIAEALGCKTVGSASAYVGSNPTPATTCEDGPLAANSRAGGAFLLCPGVCRLVAL